MAWEPSPDRQGEELSCLQVFLASVNGPAMETFKEETAMVMRTEWCLFLDLSEAPSCWGGSLLMCAWL